MPLAQRKKNHPKKKNCCVVTVQILVKSLVHLRSASEKAKIQALRHFILKAISGNMKYSTRKVTFLCRKKEILVTLSLQLWEILSFKGLIVFSSVMPENYNVENLPLCPKLSVKCYQNDFHFMYTDFICALTLYEE